MTKSMHSSTTSAGPEHFKRLNIGSNIAPIKASQSPGSQSDVTGFDPFLGGRQSGAARKPERRNGPSSLIPLPDYIKNFRLNQMSIAKASKFGLSIDLSKLPNNSVLQESSIYSMDKAQPGNDTSYLVHNRIMGWKLTTPNRRKALISLLDELSEHQSGFIALDSSVVDTASYTAAVIDQSRSRYNSDSPSEAEIAKIRALKQRSQEAWEKDVRSAYARFPIKRFFFVEIILILSRLLRFNVIRFKPHIEKSAG